MFSHNIDFNRHVAKVHERNKPFDCKLCDKNFSQNSKGLFNIYVNRILSIFDHLPTPSKKIQ